MTTGKATYAIVRGSSSHAGLVDNTRSSFVPRSWITWVDAQPSSKVELTGTQLVAIQGWNDYAARLQEQYIRDQMDLSDKYDTGI